MSESRIAAWAEAHGLPLTSWQAELMRAMSPPPTDKSYLLNRLNQRAKGIDPGPWERDRMHR